MHFSEEEMIRWIIMIPIISIILNTCFVAYRLNQTNDFEDNAIAIIQKEGGVTATAQSKINDLSKTSYYNDFSISAVKTKNGKLDSSGTTDTARHDFGDKVFYQINVNVPFLFLQDGGNAKIAIDNTYNGYTISEYGQ